MKRDYPGMSEENEIFLKEVLRPKGRMTVFYPEEVQLLLEELRGRYDMELENLRRDAGLGFSMYVSGNERTI